MTQQIPLSDLYQTVQTFMGGSLINFFNRFGLQWQVYVQADGDFRTNAENVGKLYVRNLSGDMVPLSTLTSTYPRVGPEFLMRYNLFNCVQINASAAPGYSSAQVMAALEDVFHKTMPSQMGFDYSGMSYQEQKAAQGVSPAVIFGLAFFVVFLIMAAQYESWTLRFQRAAGRTHRGVPGAFIALYFRHLENNVYAQIGLVMLIGLSAKNAILIVEFAKLEYDNGKSLIEASLSAARLRLRPILMTAFAFILGCVPLYTATGAGGISRQVLGTAVIGGMLASTVLAIFSLFQFSLTWWSASATSSRKKRKGRRHSQQLVLVRKEGTHDASENFGSGCVIAFALCLQSRSELQAPGLIGAGSISRYRAAFDRATDAACAARSAILWRYEVVCRPARRCAAEADQGSADQ